jgi:hypothetical protein
MPNLVNSSFAKNACKIFALQNAIKKHLLYANSEYKRHVLLLQIFAMQKNDQTRHLHSKFYPKKRENF